MRVYTLVAHHAAHTYTPVPERANILKTSRSRAETCLYIYIYKIYTCAEERKDHKRVGFSLRGGAVGESRCRSFEKRVEKSSTWLSAGDLQSPPSFLKPGQSRLAFAFRASIYVGATVNSTSPFSSTLIVFSSPCRLSRATPRARCGEPSISRGVDKDPIRSIVSFDC